MNLKSLTESHHGVFVCVLNYGVLIIGKAASGKSSFALELLHQGHQLIADDTVEFRLDEANNIIGFCPKMLNDMLHHRELGIITVSKIFGDNAHIKQHRLDYVVQLTGQHQLQTELKPPHRNHLVHQRPFPLLLLNSNNPTSLSHRLTTWLQLQHIEDGTNLLQRRQAKVMKQQ